MAINDKIRDEKLQYRIKQKQKKTSSRKIYKYEYLTGEETLPLDQRRVIEQFSIFLIMKNF